MPGMARIGFGIALGLLAGCASAPRETRTVHALRQVQDALKAQEEVLEVRHNPSACSCPPFEVRAGDGWVRARILGPEDEELGIDGLRSRSQPAPADAGEPVYRVALGVASSRVGYCPNRTPYVELEVR